MDLVPQQEESGEFGLKAFRLFDVALNLLAIDIGSQETMVVRMSHDLSLDRWRRRRRIASTDIIVAVIHEITATASGAAAQVMMTVVVVFIIQLHHRRSRSSCSATIIGVVLGVAGMSMR